MFVIVSRDGSSGFPREGAQIPKLWRQPDILANSPCPSRHENGENWTQRVHVSVNLDHSSLSENATASKIGNKCTWHSSGSKMWRRTCQENCFEISIYPKKKKNMFFFKMPGPVTAIIGLHFWLVILLSFYIRDTGHLSVPS